MARGGIKINLKGFDEMLENIKNAGGDVNQAAERALTASAKIVENELRTEAERAPAKAVTDTRQRSAGIWTVTTRKSRRLDIKLYF